MKLTIDKNNLLVIENENIEKNKKYDHNVDGYEFCDFDKGLIIYHKKQFKIINLKDLGEKMGVVLVGKSDDEIKKIELDINSIENAFKLFEGFDEETGNKYYFLYKFKQSRLKELQKKLKKLGSQMSIEKTNKGIYIEHTNQDLKFDPASFLFGLSLIYGDLSIKHNDLKSIKIQIPLFGKYIENKELLDEIINTFKDNGIFIKTTIQETNDGIVYQITSSDYELLEIFARFYQPIEKGLEISKYTDTLGIKNKLIEFLNTDKDIPLEGKSEVLKEIENGMIKILVK